MKGTGHMSKANNAANVKVILSGKGPRGRSHSRMMQLLTSEGCPIVNTNEKGPIQVGP